MLIFAEFGALILINYWILSFSQFHLVFGLRPHCTGEPLNPREFSKPEDVGYARDICVDQVARRLYNSLGYEVSPLCKELANIRTSTCFCGCSKWKRSSSSKGKITNRITTLAEALLENFVEVVSKEASLKDEEEKLFYEYFDSAKRQLVDCGATAVNSKIAEHLEDLKKFFCTGSGIGLLTVASDVLAALSYTFNFLVSQQCVCFKKDQLEQYQIAYNERVSEMDGYHVSYNKIDTLLDRSDFVDAVKQLIRNFQTTYGVKISNYYIENILAGDFMFHTGIIRLKFQYTKGLDLKESSAILKIPTRSFYKDDYDRRTLLFKREKFIYEKLLPVLHQLGKCTLNPFAPKLYEPFHKSILILEDLSVDGYTHNHGKFFFDLDETVIGLKLLAKFHALGYKYIESLNKKEQSTIIESFQPLEFVEANSWDYSTFFTLMKSHLSQTLMTKISELKEEILAYSENINQPDEKTRTVIVHGDLHRKNIFFKYDKENKPCQVKIIDFERSGLGSPVSDLMEFFVMNVPVNILEANEDVLLDSYLLTFNNNLESLSTDRKYHRLELNEDIVHYKRNYLRLLAHTCGMGPPYSTENLWILNLKNWLLYLEKKGLI